MWGIGATIGPYIMGHALTGGRGWDAGYRYIGFIQLALTAILLFSLPLWKKNAGKAAVNKSDKVKTLTLREIVRIPGVKEVMVCFFCYCALEQTTSLWASSYLTLYRGVPAETGGRLCRDFFS